MFAANCWWSAIHISRMHSGRKTQEQALMDHLFSLTVATLVSLLRFIVVKKQQLTKQTNKKNHQPIRKLEIEGKGY